MLTRFVILLFTALVAVGCQVDDTTGDSELEQLTPRPSPIEYPKY